MYLPKIILQFHYAIPTIIEIDIAPRDYCHWPWFILIGLEEPSAIHQKNPVCSGDAQVGPLWNKYLFRSITCMEHIIYSCKKWPAHNKSYTGLNLLLFTTYTAKPYQLCQTDSLQCYTKIYISLSKLIHIFRKIKKDPVYSNVFNRIKQKMHNNLGTMSSGWISFPYVRYFENKISLNCCARGVLNHIMIGGKKIMSCQQIMGSKQLLQALIQLHRY